MDKYFEYKYDDLFNPTLQALNILGGSGAVSEIEEKVGIFKIKRRADKGLILTSGSFTREAKKRSNKKRNNSY